jgi:hypothetical protein
VSVTTPRRRAPLARAAIIAAFVIGALGITACDPPTPDQDAFYTPPSPLPAAQAGDVLRSRASVFTLDPLNHTPVSGVTSTQVLYRSTNAMGQANAVSGTVLVPTTPWLGGGARPLVSWAVGTRGVGDECAPSYTLTQGADYEMLFIKAALDRGWAVAVSDYEGLGTPGLHTYVVGRSEGRAVLDMARAAIRLPGTGLSTNTPVGLMGYSQGGGAAGWAAELAGTYAPELKIKGTAAGGIPGDLTAVAEFVDGGPVVALAMLASIGLDAAYPELNLENYLNDTGRQLMTEADDLCLVSVDGIATLFTTLFRSRNDYVHTDPLAAPAWQARLAENKLGSARPNAPVYQYHGLIDEMVPYPQAAELRRTWCNKGATVTWVPLPGEHVLGMVEGLVPAMDWLSARFAGLPALGNCLLP